MLHMKKALNALNVVIDFVGNTLFVAMAATMIVQIFARFVLRVSIPWTEEMSRIIFLYVVFIGAGVATKKRSHLVIDTLSSRVPKWGKKAFDIFILLFSLIVTAVFLIGSFQMVAASTNRYFASMHTLPMSWMYLAPAIGFSLIFFYLILELICIIMDKGPEVKQ